MRLAKTDHVVGAWAERCAGPGWSNRLIWVCIRSALDGSHRVDSIQPEEMTPQLAALLPVAISASSELIGWVRAIADAPKIARVMRRGGRAQR